MKLKAIMAGLALAAASSVVMANDIYINAGAITTDTSHPYAAGFGHSVGGFTDVVDFTIGAGSLGTSANPLNLQLFGTDVFSITGLSYELWSGVAGSLGSTSYGIFPANNITYDIGLTTGGAYHLVITGDAVGTAGGSYGLSMVSSVPEPETYGMMLMGLGLVGAIARKKARRG